MFNEGIISQNGASQAANMQKYFYLKSSNPSDSKMLALKLFSRFLFPLSGMLANRFNAIFLCIMGTEEVHRGTQRFDKGTRICYGLIYPHSY